MLSREEIQSIEGEILEELPRLLEQDEHFRDAIEGILAEKFPRQMSSARRLRELLLAPKASRGMTYEEFLAWADEDTLAEWVDGQVVIYRPASDRHQNISGFLESVLRSFVEVRQLGVVRGAPFQMKLEHGREPDLLFVRRTHLGRLKETYLEGPADLVVEIVSPESVGRDRGATTPIAFRGM